MFMRIIRWLCLSFILVNCVYAIEAQHTQYLINQTNQDLVLTYRLCLYEITKGNSFELVSCESKTTTLAQKAYFVENLDVDWENRRVARFRLIAVVQAESKNSTTVFHIGRNGIEEGDFSHADFINKSCESHMPGTALIFTGSVDSRIHCIYSYKY